MSLKPIIQTVPNSLLTAIITHIFISWSYLDLTDLATLHLRHNAYLSVILALPLILPVIWIICDLASIFPGKPVSFVMESAFGKILGKLINLIFILMLFGLAIYVLWESQLLVGNYFLPRFNLRFLIIIITGSTLYLSLHGIESVGRMAAFTLIIPLIVIYSLHFLGLSNVNTINIRPVLEGSIYQWFEAGFDLLITLTPVTAVFIYLPFFKSPKKLLQASLMSLGLVIPLFFLTLLGTIGAFGPEMTAKFTWPPVEFFHIIDLPFLLLEQSGLIFIITWYVFIFVVLSQAHFILGHLISTAFPVIKLRWAIYSAALIITIVTLLLPMDALFIKNLLKSILRYFICSYFSIILLTWILVRIRYRKQLINK